MRLNLPITEQLASCQNILLAGMGGGFDIFCGLPLYFELRQSGKTVHLANFSFSLLNHLQSNVALNDVVVGVHADQHSPYPYFPELYLSQWFREIQHEEVTIWSFKNTGVRPLVEAYRALTKHLKIDGVILIDGGVDSLIHGNEAQKGTLLEDSISLSAVNELDTVMVKLIACLGFGAELNISYGQVLENIATLIKTDDFLGSCSLVKQMPVYQLYADAVLYAHNKPKQEPSVINSSVISAVRGEFGDYHLTDKTRGSQLWISPLMPIYWFFNLEGVAKQNLFLPDLRYSDTAAEASRYILSGMNDIDPRKPTVIPLS